MPLNAIFILGGAGLFAAILLFISSKKFKVDENPLVDNIEELLSGANCGGCGFTGCHAYAEAAVDFTEEELHSFTCPVGGQEAINNIANVLGYEAKDSIPTIAVRKCNGSKQNAPAKIKFEGTSSCTLAHSQFAGETDCAYGCLGLGECVEACKFDALYMNEETGLPEVNPEICTSCGACVNVCPRDIFEIRPVANNVFVACMNNEKGAAARKNCTVACIGCMKCAKVCDGVTINSFLSYISNDADVTAHGDDLIASCPTKAIVKR
ncbi:MAG: RnfABCDGE type electron transport complex subunit B [Alphaproteobacteria bacterium]|nr:RnfABCDGE type electron transport complex subunit B [Alphaproteobacteria bacterium]